MTTKNRLKTIDGEELPCPICDTTGYWIDEDNTEVIPACPRDQCEFCGGSGYMLVATPELLEGKPNSEST